MNFPSFRLGALVLAALGLGSVSLQASTATGISGLYYTGDNAGGSGLAAGGTQDGNWSVTYASTNGGSSENKAYEGSAYVVSANYVNASWTQNTSNAQWITAPGATNNSGTANAGGNALPGNGTTGSNEGIYLYTLAFTISGTGSGNITNNVAISLTIAADDAYYVYVNPTTTFGLVTDTGNAVPTSAASASGTNAWNNTTGITLANYTDSSKGIANNSTFKVGTNYLVIEVVNSNSISGSSSSTVTNPSGLLVYQVGNLALINGQPVPEMATWLPLAVALAASGLLILRKKRAAQVA